MLNLDGYEHYFLRRSNKRGGGVSIYLKHNIHAELLDSYSKITSDYEILTIRQGKNVFSVLYRPPAILELFLEFVSVNKYNLILGGDFNVNIIENSVQTLLLTTTLNSAGFRNVITSPTRVTLSTSNSTDLFITNANTDVKVAGTVSCDISDHNTIFLSFYNHDFKKQVNKNKNTITFQSISNSNILAFRNKPRLGLRLFSPRCK